MPWKQKRIARSRKEKIAIVFLCTIAGAWFLVALLILQGTPPKETSLQSTRHLDTTLDHGAPPVIGKHIVLSVEDRATEAVYAMPSSKNNIRGIALLLHGCSHSALKFFSPSTEHCPTCIGLSEELRIARILLQQQTLAVVAVTSQDRKSGCWSDRDVPHIQDALDHFRILLPSPKIVAFGASSGGRFAAQLAVRNMVDAVMVGVMNLGDRLVIKWLAMTKPKPIYLAPMPKDKATLNGNQLDFAAMTDHGPVVLDTTTCVERPVTAAYLNQRVPHMTRAAADLILPALVASGHLDPSSGLLVKDPTRSDWRDVLKNTCGEKCLQDQPLGPGVSPLAKALHRAWAFHEYCSEATLKALLFFQKELGGPPLVASTASDL